MDWMSRPGNLYLPSLFLLSNRVYDIEIFGPRSFSLLSDIGYWIASPWVIYAISTSATAPKDENPGPGDIWETVFCREAPSIQYKCSSSHRLFERCDIVQHSHVSDSTTDPRGTNEDANRPTASALFATVPTYLALVQGLRKEGSKIGNSTWRRC